MKNIILFLIALFFPKTCSLCSAKIHFADKGSLCPKCRKSLERNNGLVCQKCSLALSDGGAHCNDCKRSHDISFDRLVSPYIYKGQIKKLIHKFKYKKAPFLAYDLSVETIELLKKEKIIDEVDVITEVPMHFFKKFKRGYNQALLIAEHIAKDTNKTLISNIVVRKTYTKALAGLNRQQRIQKLANVFVINKKYIESIKKKIILLVDDVATSCTTANRCAKVLKQAGAKKVYVVSVARAYDHRDK